ncbi:MAG: pilus assembly protein PilC [Candidatus Marinimicrobia bacterium]|nr:pilus assembly protein PilC [Candidatus Neomarinimicrobiota bacterium]|tara:strand:- start:12997 stop:14241 length:1245 start_codon:yes stop_codon:yes gene_type:complete
MPLFEYIVRNEEGKRLEGTIEANTLNEANENLLKKKYTIVKLSEKEVVFDFLGPFLDRLSLEVEKMKNKIPLTTLVFFTRQLSTMFSAGLTLEKSIFFLSQEEKHKKFKKILGNMDKNIKRGMLLSDTLERNPGVFSNLFISMVRAGEVSGKLSETLEELALYLESVEETQRKVKSAMYYPIFIIGFLVLTLFLTFTFLIPSFSSVYDSLGSELPYYTVLMVSIGEWLQNNIFSVLFLSFISIGSVWLLFLTDTGKLLKDRFLLRVPIFGKIIKDNILSKFSKTFGILVNAGVPVIDTFDLVKKVVDNRVYELAIADSKESIENGLNISQALKNTGEFPSVMIQLLSTGEETGEIDTLALKASEFYTKQVNASVDRLTSIIEPALIILVGGVIGVIIIATYLPIFHFGNAMSNM